MQATTIALALLFINVLIATFYQVDNGLYASLQNYIYSWVSWLLFVPLPGGMLVMSFLCVNLILSLFLRIPRKLQSIGLYILHSGLLVLFLTAGIGRFFVTEGIVGFPIGAEGRTVFYKDKYDFVLADKRIPFDQLKVGDSWQDVADYQLVKIVEIWKNSMPDQDNIVVQIPASIDPSRNNPAAVLDFDGQQALISSWTGGLEPRGFELPFTIKLLDFKKEYHTGTSIPRYFLSHIQVSGDITFEADIEMNKPFYYKGYSFYQSSFTQQQGVEASILAVSYNPFGFVPYIASFLLFGGAVLHFILKSRRRK